MNYATRTTISTSGSDEDMLVDGIIKYGFLSFTNIDQESLLLVWIIFNPIMDKWSHASKL